MIDERARHQLYATLDERLGEQEADTLMELLPPVGWADVATKHDLQALEERMDLRFEGFEERMDLRFESFEKRMDLRFGRLEDRFVSKQEFNNGMRAQTKLMITSMFAMMLTLAAILVPAMALMR